MSASNYLEDELLDHVLAVSAFTAPTATYLKLHVGSPGEDCTANPSQETTRQAATWTAASGGSSSLSATVSWTNLSLTSPTQETLTHWSLWDAVTSGNPLAYGVIEGGTGVTVSNGGTLNLTALTVSLD